MKIYTKTGDDGTTGLFNGERVSKNSARVEAYGTVDEVNSIIGLVISFSKFDVFNEDLRFISKLLFNIGADLATPLNSANEDKIERVNAEHTQWFEKKIDEYEKELEPLRGFILPGGTNSAAFLHLARSVTRRAERLCITLAKQEDINKEIIILLNRLSDYFFMAARYANHLSGRKEESWK